MFFVDLQPGPKNKDVYSINRLLGYVVQVQPPNAKKEVVQCTRCQRFNHTKAFCNRAPRCVKCTSSGHTSSDCPRKSRDDNVQCVNCLGRHPANYRGCIVHKQLMEKAYPGLRERVREKRAQARQSGNGQNMIQEHPRTVIIPEQNNSQLNLTYSQVTSGASGATQRQLREVINDPAGAASNLNLVTQPMTSYQNDMAELRQMMKLLTEQMSTILNLLTKVLTKNP
uniref:Uncharacterized protein n=1 Tax=Phlebotomus papatasi TaxID=29031 RepID=A0A1B0GQR5_PHLPP